MGPVADMLMMVDDAADVVKMVEKLEGRMGAGRQVTVAPGTFKPLERMYVPEDYDELLAEFMKDGAPATAQYFTQLVGKIVRRRNWTWLLTHPDLKPSDIHPSRRVPVLCCVRTVRAPSCGCDTVSVWFLISMRNYAKRTLRALVASGIRDVPLFCPPSDVLRACVRDAAGGAGAGGGAAEGGARVRAAGGQPLEVARDGGVATGGEGAGHAAVPTGPV